VDARECLRIGIISRFSSQEDENMNAKTWNQVTGIILIVLAIVGITGIDLLPGLLSVNETPEIALHVVTGALALWAGFTAGGYSAFAVTYAKYGGLFYLVLGVLGFFSADILMAAGIHLDLVCNVAHVALGAWGAYVGFMAPAAKKK
jgi:hypothetical protein